MKKRLLTLCVLLLSGTLFTACSDTKLPGSGTGDGKDPGGTSATCRNNKLDVGEICDDTVPGKECPANQSACDELFRTDKTKSSCLKELKFSGDPATCSSTCEEVFYPEAECNRSIGKTCGNKTVDTDAGEKCDSGIKTGTGHCPTASECALQDPADPCDGVYRLEGKALDCTAECVLSGRITESVPGDGCCLPGKTHADDPDCVDPVNMGEACTNDKACQAGDGGDDAYCLFYGRNTAENGKSGVCTKPCDINSPTSCSSDPSSDLTCALGQASNPTDPGFCTKKCTAGGTACAGDDFRCSDDGRCFPEAVSNATIGGPCTQDSDCGADGICFTENPTAHRPLGGYCTSGCQQNMRSPQPLIACPDTSRCVGFRINPTTAAFLCTPTCKTNSDCRTGYFCTERGLCDSLGKTCNDGTECDENAGEICYDYGTAQGGKACTVGAKPTTGKQQGEFCSSVSECQGPENTICLEYGRNSAYCATECMDDTQCDTASGYKCAKTVNTFGREYNVCMKDCSSDPTVCSSGLPPSFTCRTDIKTFDDQAASLCGVNPTPNTGKLCELDQNDCTGMEPSCFQWGTINNDTQGICSASCDTKCAADNEVCVPLSGAKRCIVTCNPTVPDSCQAGTVCTPVTPQGPFICTAPNKP